MPAERLEGRRMRDGSEVREGPERPSDAETGGPVQEGSEERHGLKLDRDEGVGPAPPPHPKPSLQPRLGFVETDARSPRPLRCGGPATEKRHRGGRLRRMDSRAVGWGHT